MDPTGPWRAELFSALAPGDRGWADAFRLDIVNPHYGPYSRGEGLPADWYPPVPSFFLTLRAGLEWRLRVVYAPLGEPRGSWMEEVGPGIEAALTGHGLGAKKSWGYGLFQILERTVFQPGAGPAEGVSTGPELDLGGRPVAPRPSPGQPGRPGPIAEELLGLIETLKSHEFRSYRSRIERDLPGREPRDRARIVERIESRLRELGWRDRDRRGFMEGLLPGPGGEADPAP